MRVAVLSTFPPEVCGIGQYAAQQEEALRSEGSETIRIDLGDLRDHGWRRRFPSVLATCQAADRIVVHFQVSLYQDGPRALGPLRALAGLRRLRMILERFGGKVTVFVHEWSWHAWKPDFLRIQRHAVRRALRNASEFVFHTPGELESFGRFLFRPATARVQPASHYYKPRILEPRPEARRRLGIAQPTTVLLMLGHFTPAKGFTEFAQSFMRWPGDKTKLRLVAVTSLRIAHDPVCAAAFAAFQSLVRGADGIELRDGYVSDEDFDRWLLAADVAVVPYRSGFTASVAARSVLFGTPCLLSRGGPWSDQAKPGDRTFESERSLHAILDEIAASRWPVRA